MLPHARHSAQDLPHNHARSIHPQEFQELFVVVKIAKTGHNACHNENKLKIKIMCIRLYEYLMNTRDDLAFSFFIFYFCICWFFHFSFAGFYKIDNYALQSKMRETIHKHGSRMSMCYFPNIQCYAA